MESAAKENYTLPIIMMVALFFMISFATGLQNPFGIIVKNQLAINNLISQLGNAANFIAYAFMDIPAGMLLQRIGYRKIALLAVIVGFRGVDIPYLSGVVGSYAVYLTGAFVSGLSACMLDTVVNPMSDTLDSDGNEGNQLVQVADSVNSIGATIAPVLISYSVGDAAKAQISDVNPASFLIMGVFIIVFIVLFCVQIPESHMVKKNEAKVPDKHSVPSFRHFILGAIIIFLYVDVKVGIPNFVNLLATSSEISIDPTVAGSVVGAYWFLTMIGCLSGASFGAKISSKAMLSSAATVGMIFILIAIFTSVMTKASMPVFLSDVSFGMVKVPVGIMFMAPYGLCTSITWGGISNLAVEDSDKYMIIVFGIFMVMVYGGSTSPLIQGTVADIGGFATSSWVVFLGLAYLLYYALIGSKNVNKDVPVE